jgi:NADH:ubiquinone oxidoreductase subunit
MQMQGDTKAGTLVGTDRWGNSYYENLAEDLPLRTRWISYKDYETDASQIDPGWHAWISYLVDKPPTEDPLLEIGRRPWDDKTARVNYTMSRGAYRPYSTYVALPSKSYRDETDLWKPGRACANERDQDKTEVRCMGSSSKDEREWGCDEAGLRESLSLTRVVSPEEPL